MLQFLRNWLTSTRDNWTRPWSIQLTCSSSGTRQLVAWVAVVNYSLAVGKFRSYSLSIGRSTRVTAIDNYKMITKKKLLISLWPVDGHWSVICISLHENLLFLRHHATSWKKKWNYQCVWELPRNEQLLPQGKPIRLYWQFTTNFANKSGSNSVSSRKTSEFRRLTEDQSHLFQEFNSFYNYAHFLILPKNQYAIQEMWVLLVSFVKALMYVPFLILTCLTYLT